MAHPDNAAFVSKDGLVSFDEYGRKLDALGNVAWGDYQSLKGAGAQPRQEYWDRKFQEEMAAMQQAAPVEAAPSQWRAPAAGGYDPLSSARVATAPGQTNNRRQDTAPSVTQGPGAPNNYQTFIPMYQQPGQPSQQGSGRGAAPRYDPLSSGQSGRPSGGNALQQYVQGLGLPMPDNRVFDPYTMDGGQQQQMQQPAAPVAPAMAAPYPPMGTMQAPRPTPTGMPTSTPGQLPPAMEYLRQQGLPFGGGGVAMDAYVPAAPGANNRPMGTSAGTATMPTRNRLPVATGTPNPMAVGTPVPVRAPTWTPYQPYGVTSPLPTLAPEDEESINQAVLWR